MNYAKIQIHFQHFSTIEQTNLENNNSI